MNRFTRNILSMFCMLCYAGSATVAQDLSGRALDEDGLPIANVNIALRALHRYTATDQGGSYLFRQLPPGFYTVEFSIVGRRNEVDSVRISASDVSLDKILYASPLEFRSATITANPLKTDIFDAPEAADVVESRELDRLRGGSIMASVALIPGVALSSAGPLSAKPIIRGLGSQRVVVAENGVRHAGQQWDDDQTPEIDALDVDRIEVMRGPNSVEFGSDALGGVINVICSDIQNLLRSPSHLSGNLMVNGFTNNGQAAGALAVTGRNDLLIYKLQGSLRNAGNVTTPGGVLANTGESETNGKAMVGINRDGVSVIAGYSRFSQKSEILPDPQAIDEVTPYQNVGHDNLSLHYEQLLPSLKVSSDVLWQRDEQSEFDASTATAPQVDLILRSTSLSIKAEHNQVGPVVGSIGVSAERQRNITNGEMATIPGFWQSDAGGFIHEEATFKPITIAAGLRYDARQLRVEDNTELGVPAQTRNYSALTGSFGAVWHATDRLVIATDVSRGWRAPVAEELFINGVDQGGMRYKVGRSDLTTEASVNVDLSVRYISHAVKTELTFFRNRINDFIYLHSTGERDAGSGLLRYATRQSNGTLSGTEFTVQTFFMNGVSAECSADVVIGTNDESGEWLPTMPPARLFFGLRFSPASAPVFRNSYIYAGSKIIFGQNRVGEYEDRTGGYTLFGIGVGGEIPTGMGNILFDCSVDNLFDRAYADHLSRYKRYALNPGRNIILKLSVPFDLAE